MLAVSFRECTTGIHQNLKKIGILGDDRFPFLFGGFGLFSGTMCYIRFREVFFGRLKSPVLLP